MLTLYRIEILVFHSCLFLCHLASGFAGTIFAIEPVLRLCSWAAALFHVLYVIELLVRDIALDWLESRPRWTRWLHAACTTAFFSVALAKLHESITKQADYWTLVVISISAQLQIPHIELGRFRNTPGIFLLLHLLALLLLRIPLLLVVVPNQLWAAIVYAVWTFGQAAFMLCVCVLNLWQLEKGRVEWAHVVLQSCFELSLFWTIVSNVLLSKQDASADWRLVRWIAVLAPACLLFVYMGFVTFSRTRALQSDIRELEARRRLTQPVSGPTSRPTQVTRRSSPSALQRDRAGRAPFVRLHRQP
jgi:hypothetical protein